MSSKESQRDAAQAVKHQQTGPKKDSRHESDVQEPSMRKIRGDYVSAEDLPAGNVESFTSSNRTQCQARAVRPKHK